MKFELAKSNAILNAHSGLVLAGSLLCKTDLSNRLNQVQLESDKEFEISNADVAFSYLGLLCQGKSDYDDIEPFRRDQFFHQAMNIKRVPSSPTLRQRLDSFSESSWGQSLCDSSIEMLKSVNVKLTPAIRNLIPLDTDVSPFDNSGSHKEGVERTYKDVDGYAPIFFYLGKEGYMINQELRAGSTHSQTKGTTALLKRTIGYARQITPAPLLFRLDAAHDSLDNILLFQQSDGVEHIIKHNLRTEPKESWLYIAKDVGDLQEPRPGKKVWIGDCIVELERDNITYFVRAVFRVIERTIDKHGQQLLIPELEVDVWYTSLPDAPQTIIALYQEHGTMEQFHSEFKTELDLERLPSGKFATNALVLDFGMLAYNMLRLIGQESLNVEQQPLRKKVQRRRIRTVIQNIIMMASRLVYHGRRWKLSFGKHSPWFPIFEHIYLQFA